MASLIQQHGWYYLQFHDRLRNPRKKQVPLRTRTKRVAQQLARKLEDQFATGDFDPWLDPVAQQRQEDLSLLGWGINAFLVSKSHLSPYTVKNYRERLKPLERYLGAAFAAKSVTSSHLAGFLDSTKANDVSRKTYVRHLRVFFRWLIERRIIRKDPTEGVLLKKVPHKFVRFLTPEDVQALLRAIQDGRTTLWLIPVIRITVQLGLRRGEVCHLRWSSINLEDRILTVENTDTFRTKSGADRRIPISEDAYHRLLELHSQRTDSAVDDYVFQHSAGRITESYLSHRFLYYRRKAGLPDNINFHSLRHTTASWLIQNGASVEAIRQFLGHHSITVTEKYSHLSQAIYTQQITSALREATK